MPGCVHLSAHGLCSGVFLRQGMAWDGRHLLVGGDGQVLPPCVWCLLLLLSGGLFLTPG
jgi:hypothetical protein